MSDTILESGGGTPFGTAESVTVVGAGLAGSECAWQLAERGIPVFPDFPAFVRDLLSRIPDGPEKKK